MDWPAITSIYGEGTGVVRVACWKRCRRKFTEAMGSDAKAASFILRLIGNLYHLDNEWQRLGITYPAQRAHLRQRDFAPTLSLLHKATVLLRNRARPTTNRDDFTPLMPENWKPLVVVETFNRGDVIEVDNVPSGYRNRHHLY